MIKETLRTINQRIIEATQKKPANLNVRYSSNLPRLVAVTKFKPISAIVEAYECGQRYFGENYIQELEEKSKSKEILEKCPDIKFHFIGHLQSGKANRIPHIKNLHMFETVDSLKLAKKIDNGLEKHVADVGTLDKRSDKLKVMIQVNTSEEPQKSGIEPNMVANLAQEIVENCKYLQLVGLMTIGSAECQNKDFVRLYETRDKVAEVLNLPPCDLELSMGMSGDFESAIMMGSTSVRVGSLIFGSR